MKFACSQAALTKAINTVSKAVSARTTIPILKGILLSVKNSKLTLSASDLDISIETCVEVQNAEEGSCVVSAKLFGDIVRKLPNSIICAYTNEEKKLEIECLGTKFSIVSLPSEEFPVIKGIDSENYISIEKEKFVSLVKQTVFAASADEKKGILTGVLFNFDNSGLEIVALDGFRMAVSKGNIETGLNKKIIIPARLLGEINKILIDSEAENISLLIDEKKIEVITEDTRVVARLLEGDFIKYRDIIPASYKTRIILSRTDVLYAIERASLLAKEGKNNLIKISVAEGLMNISSRSEEGNVNEKISADISGDDIVIGFNSKYLIDVLKAVDDEEVAFEMGTSVSACLIKPVDTDSYTFLVLPVRITA